MDTQQQTTTTPVTPKADVKIEPFPRNLRCELTQEEVNERAREAARLVAAIDEKKEALQAATKVAKAQIAEDEAEFRRITEEVRMGATWKQVACERRYIFRTGVVQEVRLDTGRVLAERAMSERERQLDLPLPSKSNGSHDGENGNGARAETDDDDDDDWPAPAAAAPANDDDDDAFGTVEEAPLPTAKPKRGRPRKGAKPS